MREGNTLRFRWPADLAAPGFEFRALPSGAHAVTSDTIVFDADGDLAVCVYRARRADAAHRSAARAISAGLVVAGGTPSERLLAALPHLDALAEIAERILDGAACAVLGTYAAEHESQATPVPPAPLCDAADLAQVRFDPVTHLGAVHHFLGPLLGPLIKALYLPETRLLIYCPVPLSRAAIIGFNLAEIVSSALASGHSGRHMHLLGHVTLHDLDALRAGGWIAWTSERMLVEKRGIADYVLDASDFFSGRTTAASRPIVHGRDGPLRWSTRDAALFFELGAQERQYEGVLTTHKHPLLAEWFARGGDDPFARHRPLAPEIAAALVPRPWRYARQDARWLLFGGLVVVCAYIRFWLAEWWLVRAQLRVVIPSTLLVPLGPNANLLEVSFSESSSSIDTSDRLRAPKDMRRRSASMCSGESELDPLVAASGCASSPAQAPGLGPGTPPRAPARKARQTILPTHPRFDARLARSLPFETLSGIYLFTLWSSWIRAMHVQASAYLCALVEADDAPCITVGARDMHALNFDSGDPLDVRIVHSIVAQWGTDVHVRTFL